METIVLNCWVDLEEHEYCVNINNGPVPDATFASYDEMDAYVKVSASALALQILTSL